jgi:hypothetical protein
MITMIAQQAWPREEREMIRTRVTRDKLNRFLYFTFCFDQLEVPPSNQM